MLDNLPDFDALKAAYQQQSGMTANQRKEANNRLTSSSRFDFNNDGRVDREDWNLFDDCLDLDGDGVVSEDEKTFLAEQRSYMPSPNITVENGAPSWIQIIGNSIMGQDGDGYVVSGRSSAVVHADGTVELFTPSGEKIKHKWNSDGKTEYREMEKSNGERYVYSTQYDANGNMSKLSSTYYDSNGNGVENIHENYVNGVPTKLTTIAYASDGSVDYKVINNHYNGNASLAEMSYPSLNYGLGNYNSCRILYFNPNQKLSLEQGSEVTINADGTVTVKKKDGTTTNYDKDGNVVDPNARDAVLTTKQGAGAPSSNITVEEGVPSWIQILGNRITVPGGGGYIIPEGQNAIVHSDGTVEFVSSSGETVKHRWNSDGKTVYQEVIDPDGSKYVYSASYDANGNTSRTSSRWYTSNGASSENVCENYVNGQPTKLTTTGYATDGSVNYTVVNNNYKGNGYPTEGSYPTMDYSVTRTSSNMIYFSADKQVSVPRGAQATINTDGTVAITMSDGTITYYDQNGNVTEAGQNPVSRAGSAAAPVISGNTITFANNVTITLSSSERAWLDGNQNVVVLSSDGSNGREYDSRGNQIADIHYYSDGRIYYQDLYTYDANNKVSSHTREVVNGGGTDNYTEYFNSSGKVTRTDYFSITTGNPTRSETYEYGANGSVTTTSLDAAGNVTGIKEESTDASGAKIVVRKDANGLVLSTTKTYDSNGSHITEERRADGSLSSKTVSNSNQTERTKYDENGKITEKLIVDKKTHDQIQIRRNSDGTYFVEILDSKTHAVERRTVTAAELPQYGILEDLSSKSSSELQDMYSQLSEQLYSTLIEQLEISAAVDEVLKEYMEGMNNTVISVGVLDSNGNMRYKTLNPRNLLREGYVIIGANGSVISPSLYSLSSNGGIITKSSYDNDYIQELLQSGAAQIVTKDFFDYLVSNGYDFRNGISAEQFSVLSERWTANSRGANPNGAPSVIDWRADESGRFANRLYTEDDADTLAKYEADTAELQSQSTIMDTLLKNIMAEMGAITAELANRGSNITIDAATKTKFQTLYNQLKAKIEHSNNVIYSYTVNGIEELDMAEEIANLDREIEDTRNRINAGNLSAAELEALEQKLSSLEETKLSIQEGIAANEQVLKEFDEMFAPFLDNTDQASGEVVSGTTSNPRTSNTRTRKYYSTTSAIFSKKMYESFPESDRVAFRKVSGGYRLKSSISADDFASLSDVLKAYFSASK
ncbi:MAG: hypothetical protein K6A44_04690 [bacterium]|nr:hypothetical protein [bacterium]